MVHSVYSDRDIFLRELFSNTADAFEKLRYEAIADRNSSTTALRSKSSSRSMPTPRPWPRG